MKSKYIVQILLLSAVWGVSFLLIRISGEVFPPAWVALIRCLLGAALLWAVLLVGRHQLPPWSSLGWLVLVAFFNNAIPFTFIAWGERTVPSNIASVINATTPIWTLLISLGIHRTHATLRTIAGVLVAFAGVVLVVATHAGDPAADNTAGGLLLGACIIAVASLGYAIATVMAKIKLKGLNPIGLATVQLSLAVGMILPVAMFGSQPSGLRPAPVAAIALLGFAGSGLAYLLYYHLLSHVSATHVSAVTYLLPIWGLFWGFLAGEQIGGPVFLGVGMTIAGLVLLNLSAKAQPTPNPTADYATSTSSVE